MLDGLVVLGVIPPERGRPRTRSGADRRGGFFRNFWHGHWERVKHLYGQRWQVETFFSMLKRLLGSFLRATRRWSRHREMCLKVITLNLMLIAPKPREIVRFSSEQTELLLCRRPSGEG